MVVAPHGSDSPMVETVFALGAEDTNRRCLQRFLQALFRTRTGDPLLTMEVLYQLS